MSSLYGQFKQSGVLTKGAFLTEFTNKDLSGVPFACVPRLPFMFKLELILSRWLREPFYANGNLPDQALET